jgi:hypothetical protein
MSTVCSENLFHTYLLTFSGLSGMSGVVPVDHSQHIKPASKAAQCSVCHGENYVGLSCTYSHNLYSTLLNYTVLITQIWQRGTTHFIEALLSEFQNSESLHDRVWDVKEVERQMQESCEEEVCTLK